MDEKKFIESLNHCAKSSRTFNRVVLILIMIIFMLIVSQLEVVLQFFQYFDERNLFESINNICMNNEMDGVISLIGIIVIVAGVVICVFLIAACKVICVYLEKKFKYKNKFLSARPPDNENYAGKSKKNKKRSNKNDNLVSYNDYQKKE